MDSINNWINILNTTRVYSNKTFGDLLRSTKDVELPPDFKSLSLEVQNEVIYRVKYEGYLKRELSNIEKFKSSDSIIIPKSFSYKGIPGLRKESIEKLDAVFPNTLGQASRIPGVNPSDIEILSIMIKNHRNAN
jgi:tRNA uridine 5-carboxymethylaminomethyl modification enzyme